MSNSDKRNSQTDRAMRRLRRHTRIVRVAAARRVSLLHTCVTIQLYRLPSAAELALVYAAEYAIAAHYEADADRCRMFARTYYQGIAGALKRYDAKVSSWIMRGLGWVVRAAHRRRLLCARGRTIGYNGRTLPGKKIRPCSTPV